MRKKILETIYQEFRRWSVQQHFCCSKGCAACCSRNVTITALEGKIILQYLGRQGRPRRLADILHALQAVPGPLQTTNEYVSACLEEKDALLQDNVSTEKCPFLIHEICTIYPARPFSCRCFASTQRCAKNGSALVSPSFLSGTLAVMQIIEHLGQFEYWGNMTDILMVIGSQSPELQDMDQRLVSQALDRLRTARPLPGFIIPPEDNDRVSLLLQAIFSSIIDGKTVEQILNGN